LENPMANLLLSIVPFIVTFSIAAWHSPSATDKSQSTLPACCGNIG
jgi:hypothetical protein